MSDDHYFTARPASEAERSTIDVRIADRILTVDVANGVFSAGKLDPGTAVLLDHVSAPPTGTLVDLGCGWGPITMAMALQSPEATIWAVDVNERALDLTRRNVKRLRASINAAHVNVATPADVPRDLLFDELWSNPPIRIGKKALHALLTMWLPRLRSGGQAHLVVQRNLGSDSLARWIGGQIDNDGQHWGEVERVASAKGFRVLRFTRQ